MIFLIVTKYTRDIRNMVFPCIINAT
ncbi:hypothetical protein Anas_09404, partial [Armadillidium nasatum]